MQHRNVIIIIALLCSICGYTQSDPFDWFMKAVVNNDVEMADNIAKSHPSYINKVNAIGWTPLCRALNGNMEMSKYLIEHGADISLKGCIMPPMALAVGHAGSLPILKLLLKKGADVNAVCFSDSEYGGYTALHLAKEAQEVNFLISHGANIEARDADGRTPIFFCTDNPEGKENKPTLFLRAKVEILIKAGANIHAVTDKGKFPYWGNLADWMAFEKCKEGYIYFIRKGIIPSKPPWADDAWAH